MGIKLDVPVETPLSDDDRDILAGLSVMMLAIANRQPMGPQEEEVEPQPCGMQNPEDPDRYCISDVGHKGRHKFRPIDGLPN